MQLSQDPNSPRSEAIQNGHRSTGNLAIRIRRAIDQLKALTRDASLGFALEVGRIVVDTIHDGDLGAWRKRGRKEHALRSLSANPELPISASALYRALAIYELSRRTGNDVATWKHLGVSHLRAVLGLDQDSQRRLLSTAEVQRWTVARLEHEVSAFRSEGRGRGGRRPIPRYVKSIRQIHQLTSPEALEGFEGSGGLKASELEELAMKLSQVQERLALLEKLLPRRRAGERGA